MGVEKQILNVALTVQSAGLVGNSLKLLNKKKKNSHDFLKTGVETIVGSALIKEQANFIGSM